MEKEELKVLVIEDSALDAELICDCLQCAGYQVFSRRVDNGAALREGLASPWDIVLCDHAMPGFDVFSALQIFKDFGQDIPFIMISGTIGEENVVRLMKAGCHDCVMKHNLARLPGVVERELKEAAIRKDNRLLRARLERYQLLAEKASDPMFFLDQGGNILEANHAATHTYGYTMTELLTMNLATLATRPGHAAGMGRGPWIAPNAAVYQTVHYKKDHSAIDVEMSLQGTVLDNRMVFLSIARDISERKRAERLVNDARVAAELANNAKSEFIANMSHEFRTPMNAIIGMTDLVLMTELSSVQRTNLGYVKAGAYRLLTLINNILDISKIESGAITSAACKFKLSDIIEEQNAMFHAVVQDKPIQFICQLAEDVPEQLVGDPLMLHQVLNNLIGNAIKFTEYGRVSLNIRRVSNGPETIKIAFEVADTGIGIPAGLQDKLFIYFSQVDSSLTKKYGGSGLGLAIAQALVRKMGGEIEVESEPGKGSIFRFAADFMLARQGI